MLTATFINIDGLVTQVEIEKGKTLMEGARDAGISAIVAECGGSCACATCHVLVDEAWLSKLDAIKELESEMLACTAVEAGERSRLSCQLIMTDALDGIVLHLPETQV